MTDREVDKDSGKTQRKAMQKEHVQFGLNFEKQFRFHINNFLKD